MRILIGILGGMLVCGQLMDAFETIVLPRRGTRRIRFTRFYFRATWVPWVKFAGMFRREKNRENALGFFGPLSLLGLLACWAFLLIFGFGMVYFSLGSAFWTAAGWPRFGMDLYLSGTTFFTLGIGDVTPHSPLARVFTVAESGMGFAFLALVIGYLPVIYQAFSRREVNISLLDARAGSPPSAGELLRRHSYPHGERALQELLRDWERWCGELMESHLSYAVLCYYRSQHNNQSWLAALCTVLDTCAFVMAEVEGACQRQAELTFAMARHALVDLAGIFVPKPSPNANYRLRPEQLAELRSRLRAAGFALRGTKESEERLSELRKKYEPFAIALARYLRFRLPEWLPAPKSIDNWQTSAWGREKGFWHDDAPESSAPIGRG